MIRSKSNTIEWPRIPRSISGLKKDGTRDKRFKKGATMAEMQEYMAEIAGTIDIYYKKK